ncbi:SdpI family protein [Lactiplantibacillus dongliensis]|uniref:SdpI family protein n=1 Tax=Lactiplantibacillus dongliensis TaxID=2559919 RepID=A0ABW1R3K1_9LACO|nr:SdpI family protein [Lactiplantibacillus dongliensis]
MMLNQYGLTGCFLIFLLVWGYQWRHMPKFRSLWGYTSRRAGHNKTTWQFAQNFYAMLGVEIFGILTLASLVGLLLQIAWLQSSTLQILGLALGLIMQNVATERELRHQFPNQPTPKA